MSDKSNKKTQILRPIKKMVDKKAGPAENISAELLNDKAIGEYIRLFVGTAGGTPTELILHHAIGVTDLDADEWVASSPDEIAHMKTRSKDPNYASLIAKRTQYIRDKAIEDDKLVVIDGSVYHAGEVRMERSKFLDALKKSALKKHQGEKNYKFILSVALDEADQKDPLVQMEKAYRNWVGPIQAEAEEKFPQTYRTMKGPLSDTPQVAISWLKAKKIAEVEPMLIKHGVNGPVIFYSKTIEKDDFTTSGVGNPTQWFFFNHSNNTVKDEVRKHAKKIRELVGKTALIVINEE
jgi:hypothetical protein